MAEPLRVYILLGSNIDKEQNLLRAMELLTEMASVVAVSSVYETAPVGGSGEETFLNAAVVVETDRPPQTLQREVLASIEDRLGRRRTADKNAPRTIDLDIVLYGDRVLDAGGRRIPDPEILSRAHLAVPLAEVAPSYVHPVTGQTLAEIAAPLGRRGGIKRRPDLDLRKVLSRAKPEAG